MQNNYGRLSEAVHDQIRGRPDRVSGRWLRARAHDSIQLRTPPRPHTFDPRKMRSGRRALVIRKRICASMLLAVAVMIIIIVEHARRRQGKNRIHLQSQKNGGGSDGFGSKSSRAAKHRSTNEPNCPGLEVRRRQNGVLEMIALARIPAPISRR